MDNGNTPIWTSFWQYETTDQIIQHSDPWPATPNGILQFDSFEPIQEISHDDAMDPIPGGEIEFRKVFRDNGKWRWGADLGIGFLASSETIEDSLELRWIVDSYIHPFDVATMPGPLDPQQTYLQDNNKIQNTPARNVSTVNGSATRNFDTQMTMFRLGAFADWQLNPKFRLGGLAGVTGAMVDADYHYVEQMGTFTFEDSFSYSEFLVGGYVGVDAAYSMTDRFALLLSTHYQFYTDLDFGSDIRTAYMEFSSTYMLQLGLAYMF